MEISVAGQTYDFFLSVFSGMLFGVLYDIIRVVRARCRLKALTYILDALFWLVVTVLFFVFVMSKMDGEIRIYSLVGIALGGVFYFLTLSVAVIKAGFVVADILWAVFLFVSSPFVMLAKATGKLFYFCKKALYIRKKRHKMVKSIRNAGSVFFRKESIFNEKAQRKSGGKDNRAGSRRSRGYYAGFKSDKD